MALNSPRTGNLHGVLGVDYQCYRQAKQAKLSGTFKGLLLTEAIRIQAGTNLEALVRFKDRYLPVVNLKVRCTIKSIFPKFCLFFFKSRKLS